MTDGTEMDDRGARRAAAALLAAVPVLVAVGWLLATRWDTPSDGTVTGRRDGVWATTVPVDEVRSPGSPLRVGDQVVAVEGVTVGRPLPPEVRARLRVGSSVTYRVLRPGSATALDVVVPLRRYPLGRALGAHLPTLLLPVSLTLLGAFVLSRRPDRADARVLYAIAVILPVTATTYPLGPQVVEVVSGRLWPFAVGDVGNALLWGALLHFALVLGDPSRRLRRAALAAYLPPFVGYLVGIAVHLPPSGLERVRALISVSTNAARFQPLLVTAAMVVAYRRARDEPDRRRMRWALVTFVVTATAYLVLGQFPSRLTGGPLVPWDWLAWLFLPFPVVLGIAVVRHRLFDVEFVVRRSLVLGALTAGLGAVYLVVDTGLGHVDGLPTAVAPFVVSLVVVVLFGPLQTRVRRLVSRSLFGDRDDPSEVLDALGRRLEAASAIDSALDTVVTTLSDTLRLSYAAVRIDGTAERSVERGRRSDGAVVVPVHHDGERVGELELDPGPDREPFGPADRRLLDGLARQLGVVSQNLVLTQRLRDSLARSVAAREEERRRLRRDLHDGLGPRLAATGLQLEVAARLVGSDPDRARRLLVELGDAHRESAGDLRRLVEGLRPPVLDRLGLRGALDGLVADFTGQAPTGVTVEVSTDGVPEQLPAAVEVAAYRIVQEAVTNAVRHSGGTRCRVRVGVEDDGLVVEVSDDGGGLPPQYRAGVGLTSIRERATELGGRLDLAAAVPHGLTVRAVLPLGEDAG